MEIGGIAFRVVGLYRDEGGEGMDSQLYIPISTAQTAYGAGNRVHRILFTMDTEDVEVASQIQEKTLALLAQRHQFDPSDPRALRIFNLLREFQQVMGLMTAIKVALVVVGIF
ncbi:hypothetical protein RZS08_35645, partial [Arthrospira platensis SPKY1]|nr:hypothetical protein [Arthrospira platensis SPKY1]